MVVFSKTGAQKLKQIANGKLTLSFTGSISEFAEELSVILTKASYLVGENKADMLKATYLGYGAPSVTTFDLKDLFEVFGVSHVSETIPADAVSSRNNGLVYLKHLGECLRFNPTLNAWVANDGSSIKDVDATIPIKKEYLAKFMPDYHKELKKAEKGYNAKLKTLGLTGLTEGSNVIIKTYAELTAEFGEEVWVMGDDDKPVCLDASDDPYALRIIKTIKYPKVVADYYDARKATVVSIDIATGALVLDIDGQQKHNKYLEDGKVRDDLEDTVVFGLSHIKLV